MAPFGGFLQGVLQFRAWSGRMRAIRVVEGSCPGSETACHCVLCPSPLMALLDILADAMRHRSHRASPSPISACC